MLLAGYLVSLGLFPVLGARLACVHGSGIQIRWELVASSRVAIMPRQVQTLVNTSYSSTVVWGQDWRGAMLPATHPNSSRVPPKPQHCLLSVTSAPLHKVWSMKAVLGIEVGWPQQPHASLLCTQASVKVREDPRIVSSPTSQVLSGLNDILSNELPIHLPPASSLLGAAALHHTKKVSRTLQTLDTT